MAAFATFFFFFFFFLKDSRGTFMRFSPPLPALGTSERFSPKDLFIQILYFLRESRGASLRFSPSLPTLAASERFSSKDLFIPLFFFLWLRCGRNRGRTLLYYQCWFFHIFNEPLPWKGFLVDFQSMPIDKHGDGFFINAPDKEWTIVISFLHCIRS